jgi:hypothetical protein
MNTGVYFWVWVLINTIAFLAYAAKAMGPSSTEIRFCAISDMY